MPFAVIIKTQNVSSRTEDPVVNLYAVMVKNSKDDVLMERRFAAENQILTVDLIDKENQSADISLDAEEIMSKDGV